MIDVNTIVVFNKIKFMNVIRILKLLITLFNIAVFF